MTLVYNVLQKRFKSAFILSTIMDNIVYVEHQDEKLRVEFLQSLYDIVKADQDLLSTIVGCMQNGSIEEDFIWLEDGPDPYEQSKPFNLVASALTKSGLVVFVEGQRSDRIEAKWPGKLSRFFGCPTKIMWTKET